MRSSRSSERKRQMAKSANALRQAFRSKLFGGPGVRTILGFYTLPVVTTGNTTGNSVFSHLPVDLTGRTIPVQAFYQ